MLEIWNPLENPNTDSCVAIGIKRIDDRDGFHTGILHYCRELGKANFLELKWHFELANNEINKNLQIIRVKIGSRRSKVFAARCREIWEANGPDQIPYGFSHPSDSFDKKTSQYLLDPNTQGLTCASFVLAVFHVENLPLIDYNNWPINREKDVKWHKKVIYCLREIAGALHLFNLQKRVGVARYHPCEVAAAGFFAPRASTFSDIAIASEKIRDLVLPLHRLNS